jgi:hypothetical protein
MFDEPLFHVSARGHEEKFSPIDNACTNLRIGVFVFGIDRV